MALHVPALMIALRRSHSAVIEKRFSSTAERAFEAHGSATGERLNDLIKYLARSAAAR
jgi:hypothetical protein